MMYVQIPIFSGYANIAICPGHGTVCYMIDDVQKNQNLYSEMNAKSTTFLPFYENHHYILYPTAEGKLDDGVLYFHSEELMKKHILGNLGTEYVTGRSLTITPSEEAAPDVTNAMEDSFEQSQKKVNNTVITKNIENEKKKLKNKNTKKNKNIKNKKKLNLEFSTANATKHCKENSWNTVTNKKSTKLNKKNIKKERKDENRLKHNKFFVLRDNSEKEISNKNLKLKDNENMPQNEKNQPKQTRKSSNKFLLDYFIT